MISAFNHQYAFLSTQDKMSLQQWRKGFNLLVWIYNSAYALSSVATVFPEEKPTGHGESTIPKSLRGIVKGTHRADAKKSPVDVLAHVINTGFDNTAVKTSKLPVQSIALPSTHAAVNELNLNKVLKKLEEKKCQCSNILPQIICYLSKELIMHSKRLIKNLPKLLKHKGRNEMQRQTIASKVKRNGPKNVTRVHSDRPQGRERTYCGVSYKKLTLKDANRTINTQEI